MADFRPMRALRPLPEHAARVAAPPYDVVDVAEARALAVGNPDSFLHVSRPEIDLPDGADADIVHAAGRAALQALRDRGVMVQDRAPSFAVYRQRRGEQVQTGLVGCASVADYRRGVIRVHEHTRPDKEDDRVRHIDAVGAHDEPVFLLAPPAEVAWKPVAEVIDRVVATAPAYDFVADDGVGHTLWPVPAVGATGEDDVQAITAAFAAMPLLYVADGHHRSAAAARVHDLRGGSGDSGAFPCVVFPGEDLAVLPYHRVVADLGGRDAPGFLAALAEGFTVEPADGPVEPARHAFGMYLAGQWWTLHPRRPVAEADPIARLDVSVLQERLLGPLLGVTDPRRDQRIAFVGGVHGPQELARLVDSGRSAVAFSLHPTSVAELVAVAAAGQVMPPKSTWFEPKLRSGLFVHLLD